MSLQNFLSENLNKIVDIRCRFDVTRGKLQNRGHRGYRINGWLFGSNDVSSFGYLEDNETPYLVVISVEYTRS